MVAERKPLFSLGQIVATPGALAELECSDQRPMQFVDRHVRGDFGELCDEDIEANQQSLKDGSRILSSYRLTTGKKLWIITEADRSSTTLLLPEEY